MSPQEADSCHSPTPLGQIPGDLLSPFHRRVNGWNLRRSPGIGTAFTLSLPLGDGRGAVRIVLAKRHDKRKVELQCSSLVQHDRALAAPAVTSFLLLVI